MSARKSVHRRSSRYSIQSQVSGVLNPDSNIASDEESQPLWFNEFENNSVNLRPSARFSLAQNESPVLNSNSELESTPLQKSWWKNIENTSEVRFSKSNVFTERSNVQERSIVDTSDTSSLEEGVARQRFALRHQKRKSLQRNVFSEILDASKDSNASENSIQNPRNEEKQATVDSSLDTDISIEKVKKPPFKNRQRAKLVRKSTNVESKSDESLPKAFQHALDASQSVDETLREVTPSNEPGNLMEHQDASSPGSPTSGESIRLTLDHSSPRRQRIVSDRSEDTLSKDKDVGKSRSPVTRPRPENRTIFTKTTKRRTPNFDETNRSYAADGMENTESSELRTPGTEGITQGVTNGTQRSFSSGDHNGTASVQPANESLGIGSQVSHVEKLSQLKSALEKLKGKEIVLKKTTTIDSYFKKTLPTKPGKDVAAKDSQKLPSKKKPVVNENKNASVSPNKAYMVNGKVYKRPKLPRPKPWATNRLYSYLWKKMEAKYHLRTRVRSERFIVDLSQVVANVVRRKKYDNYKEELNNLIHEMARLGIIKTRKDFHTFCQNFLPYEFRIKVIPMLLPGNVRNIPFHPDKLHTPILEI